MNKTINFLGAFLLLASMAFAQTGKLAQADLRPADERAQRQTMQLTKRLNLNADQVAKVDAINLDRAKKVDELRASGKRRAGLLKARNRQADYEAKLKPILTPDQWSQYEKLRDQQKSRLRAGRKGTAPAPEGDEI